MRTEEAPPPLWNQILLDLKSKQREIAPALILGALSFTASFYSRRALLGIGALSFVAEHLNQKKSLLGILSLMTFSSIVARSIIATYGQKPMQAFRGWETPFYIISSIEASRVANIALSTEHYFTGPFDAKEQERMKATLTLAFILASFILPHLSPFAIYSAFLLPFAPIINENTPIKKGLQKAKLLFPISLKAAILSALSGVVGMQVRSSLFSLKSKPIATLLPSAIFASASLFQISFLAFCYFMFLNPARLESGRNELKEWVNTNNQYEIAIRKTSRTLVKDFRTSLQTSEIEDFLCRFVIRGLMRVKGISFEAAYLDLATLVAKE